MWVVCFTSSTSLYSSASQRSTVTVDVVEYWLICWCWASGYVCFASSTSLHSSASQRSTVTVDVVEYWLICWCWVGSDGSLSTWESWASGFVGLLSTWELLTSDRTCVGSSWVGWIAASLRHARDSQLKHHFLIGVNPTYLTVIIILPWDVTLICFDIAPQLAPPASHRHCRRGGLLADDGVLFSIEGRNRTNAYAVVPALTLPLRLSPIAMVVTRTKVSLTVLCQVICNCNLVVRWQECLTLIVSSSDKSYRESSLSLVAVEGIKSNPESRSSWPALFVI